MTAGSAEAYLLVPPGVVVPPGVPLGDAPAPGIAPLVPDGPLEEVLPVAPGVELVVSLPGVVLLAPADGVDPLLAAEDPGVLLVSAELDELVLPVAPGVAPALGVVVDGGGVAVLALLLGLEDGVLVPAAGAVSSFLPHPPKARLATNAPSNTGYFIFICSPLKWINYRNTALVNNDQSG